MTDQDRIIIHVEGGLITAISGVPFDVTVEIRDYDVDGASPEELTDTPDGPAYVTLVTNDEWTGA